MMEEQLKRINKYLSEIGYCSRREADKLIEAGRVTINGNIKSRYRSFLSDRDQRAVRTAIKTARIMGAMPYFGRTPEPLKRNITSLED